MLSSKSPSVSVCMELVCHSVSILWTNAPGATLCSPYGAADRRDHPGKRVLSDSWISVRGWSDRIHCTGGDLAVNDEARAFHVRPRTGRAAERSAGERGMGSGGLGPDADSK